MSDPSRGPGGDIPQPGAPRTDPEIEAVLAIAREAAAVVLSIRARGFEVELKGPNDPVTRADREANTLICARLAQRFPDHAIVAEESAPADAEAAAALTSRPRAFFVDPIDGTREFADGRDEFAVMIGLAESGRATLGVVLAPATGVALAGRVGPQPVAFVERADGSRSPLHLSRVDKPAEATMVVSRSHRPRIADEVRARLGIVREIVSGSVGLKVAKVALAEADIYVHGGGGCKHWDTCGPEAILAAAGGRFTDLSGGRLDYNSPDLAVRRGLAATNGRLHDAVLQAIAAGNPMGER